MIGSWGGWGWKWVGWVDGYQKIQVLIVHQGINHVGWFGLGDLEVVMDVSEDVIGWCTLGLVWRGGYVMLSKFAFVD